MFEMQRGLETEVRRIVVVIEMDMARHSIKNGEVIGQEGMEAAARSRPELEARAQEISKSGQPISIVSSLLPRAEQSGVFRTLGEKLREVNIEGMDPDDITRWLKEGGAIETINTSLLGFQMGEGEYQDKMTTAFKEGRLMRWMIEESDDVAVESGQIEDKATPLSVQAGNVAMLIYSLGRLRTEKFIDDQELVRDLNMVTSHQSVLESFLYKVIVLKEGEEAGDEFIADLNEAGFKENQGFNCKYEQFEDGAWQVRINYEGKEYVVSKEEMIQITQEGVDLKARMKSSEETQ